MSGENSEDRNYEETTEEEFLETMLEWEDSGKIYARKGRNDRKKNTLSVYAATYMDMEKLRVAQGVRITHLKLDESPESEVKPLEDVLNTLEVQSKALDKVITQIVKKHPAWTGFLCDVKGVGPHLAALVIGGIRDVEPLTTVSKVWYLCGLAVLDGEIQRKRRGSVLNYDNRLKSILLGRVAKQLLMNKDPFATKLYAEYKEYEFKRNPEIKKMHAHRRAIRRVVKLLVSCMWRAWREGEGMTAPNAWVLEHGGHTDEITPDMWIRYNKEEYARAKQNQ
tara:strand:+ start:81 stop:920 length:840 start_codon:yes stop_codon:yes gene_type:complete